MPDIVKVGTAVLAFGTTDETWGICTDYAEEQEIDEVEIRNGQNQTIGMVNTEVRTKITVNYEPLEGAVLTAPEDLIYKNITVTPVTGKTVTFLVKAAKPAYKRGEVMTFGLEGTIYPNLGSAYVPEDADINTPPVSGGSGGA